MVTTAVRRPGKGSALYGAQDGGNRATSNGSSKAKDDAGPPPRTDRTGTLMLMFSFLAGLAIFGIVYYAKQRGESMELLRGLDKGWEGRQYKKIQQKHDLALSSPEAAVLQDSDRQYISDGMTIAEAAYELYLAEVFEQTPEEAIRKAKGIAGHLLAEDSEDDRVKRYLLATIAEHEGRIEDHEAILADLAKRNPENENDVAEWINMVIASHPDDLAHTIRPLFQAMSARGQQNSYKLNRLAAEIYGLWLGDFENSYKHYVNIVQNTDSNDPKRSSQPYIMMLYDFAAVLAAMGKREEAMVIFGFYSHINQPFKASVAKYGYNEPSNEVIGPHRTPAKRYGEGNDPVRIFDGAQPETLAHGMLKAFGDDSSFWNVTRYYQRNGGATAFYAHKPFPKPGEKGRNLVHQLAEQMMAYMEPDVRDKIMGIEWWVHKRPRHRKMKVMSGHPLHFDVDEETNDGGTTYHPIWSSVTFVEGDVGGQTIVTEWDSHRDFKNEAETPHGAYMVSAQDNRFVLFRGSLYHGVLPGFPEDLEEGGQGVRGQRITLLINFWARELPLYKWDGFYDRGVAGKNEVVDLRTVSLPTIIPELTPLDQKTVPNPDEHVLTAKDIKPIYVQDAW
eukprot:Clim_evm96s134 gene=Clim_evmTU96s134